MITAHACAYTEYVEAFNALYNQPVQWLLSAEGDRAYERYTQALIRLGVELDEDEAA